MQAFAKKLQSSRGLTLIEILGVIAIMGLLAAVIIPSIHYVNAKAQKTKAASHLRQLALAYTVCMQGSEASGLQSCETIHDLAAYLAKTANLNDPQLWLLDEDPLRNDKAKTVKSILGADKKASDAFKTLPLSFTFVVKLPHGLCPSTAPIAWSRGLKEDGTWDAEKGVWGNSGGLVAFLDGHVEWYDNLKDTDKQLCHHESYAATSSFKEALGNSVKILPGN